jgi:uncharacterized protein (TIRG00374 family)
MSRLLRPSVLLPTILGAAVLAGLLSFSNAGQIATLVAGFHPIYFASFALLLLAYEVVRLAQWHLLLGTLGVHVPLRTQVFTFMTGEAARDLPAGNFVPNYLLQSTNGTNFGLASSATLLITLIEVAVSLVVVAIVGIGGWGWLRPLIVIGVAAFGMLVLAGTLALRVVGRHRSHTWEWMTRRRATQRVLDELRQFTHGEARLLRPRVLAVATVLSAAYLTLGGAGVYVIARGLGLERLGFWQLVAIYCFSVAFAAIAPLPMDFGSVEASGTGALVAAGLAASASAGLMLFNRLLSVALTLLVAAVVWLVLRQEAAAALGRHSAMSQPVKLPIRARRDDEPEELPAECDPCAA